MHESLFIQFIRAIFPKLSLYVKEKETPKNRTYLFKTMLREVYSPDQKWEGTSANTTYVAADIVEMDSPLPLKKRGSIATSNGKLPKIAMKKTLLESDINNINIMKAQYDNLVTKANTLQEQGLVEQATAAKQAADNAKARIINKLMNDGVACSVGIEERNELNFLAGLSNGIIAVEDADNSGKAIRVNYGYLPANSFRTATNGVTTRDDFEKIFEKANADGNTIIKVMLAKSQLKKIRKEQWAKELVADYEGKTYTEDSKLKTPSESSFSEAFEDEFGASIETVNRTVVIEKNGKQHSVKPWNENNIIFICNEEVGSLVWGTLAESTNPVEGVKYSTVDSYKLISKYSKNDPALQEVTSGQALILPVIEDVDQIYLLSTKAEEVDEEAEKTDTSDEYTTYKGKKYKKADLITALKSVGANVKSNSTDETLVKALNALSDEEEASVLAGLTEQ
nr:MAG TPA: major capsid protein [Bacteriophage sp.]